MRSYEDNSILFCQFWSYLHYYFNIDNCLNSVFKPVSADEMGAYELFDQYVNSWIALNNVFSYLVDYFALYVHIILVLFVRLRCIQFCFVRKKYIFMYIYIYIIYIIYVYIYIYIYIYRGMRGRAHVCMLLDVLCSNEIMSVYFNGILHRL